MSIRLLVASIFAFSALLLPSLQARSGIIYDEAIDGDLSGDGLAPTSLSFGPGSNLVSGTTGRDDVGVDRDYFTFSVAPGYAFVSLIELAGTSVVRNVSFIALGSGTQITLPTNTETAAGLLGWAHFEPVDADVDILPGMGVAGYSSTGFVPPLPAGDYTVWIQETATGTSSYSFDFQLVPVPEPGSALGIAAGVIALAAARRRRSTH